MESVRASIRPALADRYSIERELGSGAMALVFLAHDVKHDRWVAIKVLKPDLASAIGAERFHREIEVVAGLTHPHILPLYDSGEAGGLLYFVMPHVEGESLRDRLTREEQIPTAEATRIAREMADALEFAHQHGVVHRDVKPANVMLSAGHAQLADFGIAHLVEGAEATLTGTGITVGTPAYMSPEQVSGDEALDGRSDLYSLGCVLYEMLCGHPPFADASRRAVLVHQLMDAPADIREECPDVPLELVGIVKTSLEKEPAKRFASADEMSQALASVRSSIDVTAGARIRRALKRRGRRLKIWQRVALVSLVVLAAIGTPTIVNEMLRPVPEPLAVAYPTYALFPSASEGQTEEERRFAFQAQRALHRHLQGWESVAAVDGLMLEGATASVVRAGFGLPSSSLAAGLEFADRVQASHLVYVDAALSDDSVTLHATIHRIPEERPQETLRAKGPANDIALVAADLALELLNINGEAADLDQLRNRSPQPDAHQQYSKGWEMLLDWRLAEAEAFFGSAIELDPEFALAHYHLALTMYWRTVRDPERILDGESIHQHVMHADLFGDTERLRPGERRDLNAFMSFWDGDYEEARTQYAQILDQEPTRLDVLVLAGAVEVEDMWLVADEDGNLTGPRQDLNRAIAVFDSAVGLNRHVQLAWGQLFEIERDVAITAHHGTCYGFLPPGGSNFPPYEFPEAADVSFFCPYVENGLIHWRPDTLTASQAERAVAEVGVLRERIEDRLRAWSGVWKEQARPHEELADRLLWERSAGGCDTDPALAASLLWEARSHTEQALVLRGDTTPEDRLRLAALLLATDAPARAELETNRALDELGDWRSVGETPPPKSASNVYLALGKGTAAAEILEAVSGHSTWAVGDTATEKGAIPGGAVYGTLQGLRALGMTGGDSAELSPRFEELKREWRRLGHSDREQAMLRAHTTSMVESALLLQPHRWSEWFENWDLTDAAVPLVWQGLMVVRDRPEEARSHLTDAIVELEAGPAGSRRAIHYYMPIQLAERLGDDSVAADLSRRAAQCPLRLDNIDFGWGMMRYLAGDTRN